MTYSGTREDWAAHVKDLLAGLRMSDTLRAEMRLAAKVVWDADWVVMKGFGFDTLFLAWLTHPDEPWLTRPHSVDHYLPPSVMTDAGTAKAALDARDRRVTQAVEALRDWHWDEDEALAFVCSKEEWQEVRRRVGRHT